jgi:formylglycine-generating enzyme required for sulfatase activity
VTGLLAVAVLVLLFLLLDRGPAPHPNKKTAAVKKDVDKEEPEKKTTESNKTEKPPIAIEKEPDLAAKLEKRKQEAAQTEKQARALVEQHDYAGAAKLLQTVPADLRDAAFYKEVCAKRDRVAQLDQEIHDDVDKGRTAGLRPKVAELVKPQPQRKDLRALLKTLPPELAKEITNSIGMKLVLVPAGKFTMGSPKSEEGREPFDKGSEEQHEVEITEPFYMGIFEVTQRQYKEVMGINPSYYSGDDLPVGRVSWDDAMAFCKKLSELPEEKQKKRGYTLPTEAQWEYACRGGPLSTEDPFHYGKLLSSTQANFDGNYPYGGAAKGEYKARTVKVGSYKPNALGLYDMHGNVGEWCLDWYGGDYYKNSPSKDPTGPKDGTGRVLRGGSLCNDGTYCRAAFRSWFEPGTRYNSIGFRVVFAAALRIP